MGQDKHRITGAPVLYQNDNFQTKKILAKPILEHICKLGKNLNEMQVDYYCPGDSLFEFLGIFGKTIGDNTTIDLDDLEINGNKINLQLKASYENKDQDQNGAKAMSGPGGLAGNNFVSDSGEQVHKNGAQEYLAANQLAKAASKNEQPIQVTLPRLDTAS